MCHGESYRECVEFLENVEQVNDGNINDDSDFVCRDGSKSRYPLLQTPDWLDATNFYCFSNHVIRKTKENAIPSNQSGGNHL